MKVELSEIQQAQMAYAEACRYDFSFVTSRIRTHSPAAVGEFVGHLMERHDVLRWEVDLAHREAFETGVAPRVVLARNRSDVEAAFAPLPSSGLALPQRVVVVEIGDTALGVIWALHHLLVDGQATEILRAEIEMLSRGEILPPSPSSYKNFVRDQGLLRSEPRLREFVAGCGSARHDAAPPRATVVRVQRRCEASEWPDAATCTASLCGLMSYAVCCAGQTAGCRLPVPCAVVVSTRQMLPQYRDSVGDFHDFAPLGAMDTDSELEEHIVCARQQLAHPVPIIASGCWRELRNHTLPVRLSVQFDYECDTVTSSQDASEPGRLWAEANSAAARAADRRPSSVPASQWLEVRATVGMTTVTFDVVDCLLGGRGLERLLYELQFLRAGGVDV